MWIETCAKKIEVEKIGKFFCKVDVFGKKPPKHFVSVAIRT
jgi:hypothetical protein